MAIRSPDKLTQVFVALDELRKQVYPISTCGVLHHPSFPHTASSTTQHHFVSSWHCSWSTSSTIPLTLLLPPPHQDHNCSFSPLCHLHTLLRLHPPGMGGEGRAGGGRRLSRPYRPVPLPHSQSLGGIHPPSSSSCSLLVTVWGLLTPHRGQVPTTLGGGRSEVSRALTPNREQFRRFPGHTSRPLVSTLFPPQPWCGRAQPHIQASYLRAREFLFLIPSISASQHFGKSHPYPHHSGFGAHPGAWGHGGPGLTDWLGLTPRTAKA